MHVIVTSDQLTDLLGQQGPHRTGAVIYAVRIEHERDDNGSVVHVDDPKGKGKIPKPPTEYVLAVLVPIGGTLLPAHVSGDLLVADFEKQCGDQQIKAVRVEGIGG